MPCSRPDATAEELDKAVAEWYRLARSEWYGLDPPKCAATEDQPRLKRVAAVRQVARPSDCKSELATFWRRLQAAAVEIARGYDNGDLAAVTQGTRTYERAKNALRSQNL